MPSDSSADSFNMQPDYQVEEMLKQISVSGKPGARLYFYLLLFSLIKESKFVLNYFCLHKFKSCSSGNV